VRLFDETCRRAQVESLNSRGSGRFAQPNGLSGVKKEIPIPSS
jgi:hypothetical protein